MTRYAELLDLLKTRKQLHSDYAAGKLLGLTTAQTHFYRQGKRTPDAYALTRIALELEIDPLALIAEVRAQAEPNKERRAFWRDFFRRAGHRALVLPLIYGVFLWAGLENQTASAKSLTFYTLYELGRLLSRIARTLTVQPIGLSGSVTSSAT